MSYVPEHVQQFLKDLPVKWDDVRFIDGYPGKYVVIARRSGNKWYIAGINAETEVKSIELDLPFFKKKTASIVADSAEPIEWFHTTISAMEPTHIVMKPSGGFVMVLE